jgi:hypothetical protein
MTRRQAAGSRHKPSPLRKTNRFSLADDPAFGKPVAATHQLSRLYADMRPAL